MSLSIGSLYTAAVERRYPPSGEFIELTNLSFAEKAQLHLVRCGQGEPLLYLHGNYGSLLDITKSPIYQRLCNQYQVIAFDRPGSGFSGRADNLKLTLQQHSEVVLRLLDEMAFPEVSLLAHSFGGSIALQLALDNPNRLKAIFLLTPAAFPWPGSKEYATDRLVQVPLVGSVFLNSAFTPLAYAVSSSSYRRVFSSASIPDDYFLPARALAIRPKQFLDTALDTSLLWDTLAANSQRYSEITTPTLIIGGGKDTSVPAKVHAIPLAATVPKSRLVMIEQAGHHPHQTHPNEVLEAMSILGNR